MLLFGSVLTLPRMNVCTLEPQATPGHWAGLPERDAAGTVTSMLWEAGRGHCYYWCLPLVTECSLEKTVWVQFLQQGWGGGFTDVILYVIFIIVKCKCWYLFFSFCSGSIWPMWISQCMWYLMDMTEIIFPNFYKLPNVYLQVCRMIYFWKPQM